MIKFFAIFYPFVEILAIMMVIHAVLYVRTSQAAVAWSIVLVLFPWASIPLYWIFGRNRFRGYTEALQQGYMKKIREVHLQKEELEKFRAFDLAKANSPIKVFEKLAENPFTTGNKARLLVDGEVAFKSIFTAIHAARDYVLLEFFIVRNDSLGKRLKDLLLEKARSGVRIYFLYDEIGSRQLSFSYKLALEAAGVRFWPFFTRRGLFNKFQLNFRNHRKIVVVDGKKAFVGGLNIGREYLGYSKKFGHWRDTHLKVEGPVVSVVQQIFEGDWYWARREVLDLNWEFKPHPADKYAALALPMDPSYDNVEVCSLFFVSAILAAKKRIWIASPYFVPNSAVIQALQVAALRGVDVRILLPQRADHKLVYLASYSFLNQIAVPGIRIFRYQPGFMHQKVLLLDDSLASVGTANLDNRSFSLNFEINILVADEGFAGEVKAMLEKDFENSLEVDAETLPRPRWFFRFASRFAALFSPIL